MAYTAELPPQARLIGAYCAKCGHATQNFFATYCGPVCKDCYHQTSPREEEMVCTCEKTTYVQSIIVRARTNSGHGEPYCEAIVDLPHMECIYGYGKTVHEAVEDAKTTLKKLGLPAEVSDGLAI